jgi:hypothetical protein
VQTRRQALQDRRHAPVDAYPYREHVTVKLCPGAARGARAEESTGQQRRAEERSEDKYDKRPHFLRVVNVGFSWTECTWRAAMARRIAGS